MKATDWLTVLAITILAFSIMYWHSGQRNEKIDYWMGKHVTIKTTGQRGTVVYWCGGQYEVRLSDGQIMKVYPAEVGE